MSFKGKTASDILSKHAAVPLTPTNIRALLQGFTRDEIIECIQMEVRRREREYPTLVKLGKLGAKKSRAEIEMMKVIMEFMTMQLPALPVAQTTLFGGK
jgi:hypothetical protein